MIETTGMKNSCAISGDAAKLRLDRPNGACLYVTIDKDKLEKLSTYRWYANCQTKTTYAMACVPGQKTKIMMHRLLLGLQNGDPREVDHINHNGLDNRMANIRISTKSQNQHNQSGHRQLHNGKKVTSSYPGVSWHSQRCRWQSTIKHNSQQIYLGLFDNEQDAASTYHRAKNVRDTGGTRQEIKACANMGAKTND